MAIRQAIRHTLYRLGSEPKRSLKRFFLGIILFLFSVGFIYLGYVGEPLWQVAGLIVLPVALFFAGWGYVGIFANRFAQVLNKHKP